MKVVRFLQGSNLLYYKLSHSENEFQQIDFLKKTANITVTSKPICLIPRGISAKKNAILLLNCASKLYVSFKKTFLGTNRKS